jgi:hypothetical protein
MADDKHFVGGDNYLLDDLSGFKIRSSRARIIPGGQTGGLAVAPARWEPQQPQDFVKGVYDDQTVALARPRQTNQFILTGTWITAPSAAQSRSITVDSSAGFAVGNTIQIMLDRGDNFFTALAAISGNVWTIASPLPGSVGGGLGDPIENSVLLRKDLVVPVIFVLGEPGQDILGFNVLG